MGNSWTPSATLAVACWLAVSCSGHLEGTSSDEASHSDRKPSNSRDSDEPADEQDTSDTDEETRGGAGTPIGSDETPGSGSDETPGSGSEGSDSEAPNSTAGPTSCDSGGSVQAQLRRLSDTQYRNSIQSIFAGLLLPSEQYPAPSGSSVTGYSSELGHEAMSEQDVERAALAAEDVAVQIPDNIEQLLPCAADADQACAESFLDDYGLRIYRRPLSEQERSVLLADFNAALDDGFTFAEAIGVVVAHLLQAPQFLYLAEDAAPERRPLSGLELAHRLALLFWDAPPDEELLELAQSGELLDAAEVQAQAERLLSSQRADGMLVRFFREWTQADPLVSGNKSSELFPDFDDGLASSMNESFDRLVVDAVRSGRTLPELLSSTDAWVDERLAAFFALPEPPQDWQQVTLDPSIYRGLLTQPGWLASLAHSDDTSFVFRGRFVQKRLLCNEFGPPPPNAVSTQFDLPQNPTARQRSEAVRANASCVGCHELMDPIGLAFESFDAVGRHRTEDSLGRSIDSAGTLLGGTDSAVDFADHLELVAALEQDPKTLECYARQAYRFATAHRESDAESCVVQAVQDELLANDGKLSTALVAIATSEAFRYREAP